MNASWDLRRWQNRVYRNGGGQWAGTGTCGKRDPLVTTSRGTGELILQALESGATNIIIGIGGSATNDGGAGMVQALGAKLCDANGNEIGFGGGSLNTLNDIDISGLDPRLKDCVIRVACDVTNPLVGDSGASRIFGPQREPVRR